MKISTLFLRTLSPRATHGWLQAGSTFYRCALGRGGLKAQKREGDGATPKGRLRLQQLYIRTDRNLHKQMRVGRPFISLRPYMGWCDDPTSFRYNRPLTLPTHLRHEALFRADSVYDIIGVLDWNLRPSVRGRGSAIFLHVARKGYTPTDGCIALTAQDLRRLLPRMALKCGISHTSTTRATTLLVAGQKE